MGRQAIMLLWLRMIKGQKETLLTSVDKDLNASFREILVSLIPALSLHSSMTFLALASSGLALMVS